MITSRIELGENHHRLSVRNVGRAGRGSGLGGEHAAGLGSRKGSGSLSLDESAPAVARVIRQYVPRDTAKLLCADRDAPRSSPPPVVLHMGERDRGVLTADTMVTVALPTVCPGLVCGLLPGPTRWMLG